MNSRPSLSAGSSTVKPSETAHSNSAPAVGEVGEAEALDLELHFVLDFVVGHVEGAVVVHALAVHPGALLQVGRMADVDDVGRLAAVDAEGDAIAGPEEVRVREAAA